MRRLSLLTIFLWLISPVFSQNKEKLVMISTDKGDMIVKLYNNTPKHRDNFLKLVKENSYNGSRFHRVIGDFMIQGGKIDGINHTLPAEIKQGLYHKKGALAAARQPDKVNQERQSSGSQFFLVEGKIYSTRQLKRIERSKDFSYTDEQIKTYTSIGGAPNLDGEYTVFGEVVMGLQILERISKVKTDKNDSPVKPVEMDIKRLE